MIIVCLLTGDPGSPGGPGGPCQVKRENTFFSDNV
jgi:hypothetical protein